MSGSTKTAESGHSEQQGAPVLSDAFFKFREFSENAFRGMEVQICGETRTVQFGVWDRGGDHPTEPSVAISFTDAEHLANWVLTSLASAREVQP